MKEPGNVIMAKILDRPFTEEERRNPLYQCYNGVNYRLAPAEGILEGMNEQYPHRLLIVVHRQIPVRVEIQGVLS